MPKVTLEKIAKDIGVSKVAVFKALNDRDGVSDSLRKRIKEHAKQLGYQKQKYSSSIRNKKYIFFINQTFFLTLSEQFYSSIFNHLNAECNNSDSFLQIAFLEPDKTLEKMKRVISFYNPDGIFFAGQVTEEILTYTKKISITSVFIDFFSPLHNLNYVYVDNYHMSYQLTTYLINNGHKKIGFIGNINSTSSITDRFFGYQKALIEHNITYDKNWHINYNLEKNKEMYPFDKHTLPSAYICHCDAAAQYIYTSLAIKGVKIPEDISVVSFDNTVLCTTLNPKLTSISVPKHVYAKKAFTAMVNCIKNNKKAYNLIVYPELVERESVKAL